MPNSQSDPLLLIRCPSCGQRFKVADDLRGRTVECGGCEHRFRINDDVIVRGQKFYPGERKNPGLNQFQRVPLAITPDLSSVAQVKYSEAPDPSEFEPAAPQRIIAGAVAVVGMLLMALLLMFGAHRGGMLDGMSTQNRLIMAGFTGLLGTVLLVYANPRARVKGIGFGGLLSAGLLALPFVFTEGSVALSDLALAATPPAAKRVETATARNEKTESLRNLIGTAPLEAQIRALQEVNSDKHAYGLWLRGLREQNRFLVRDYIRRVTGADPHYYLRGEGDFLMVVAGTRQSLDEVARHASVLGSLEKIYTELAVAEIRINNDNFLEQPIEVLTDRGRPEFYSLNKKELENIDLDRVKRAVQRLSDVEPNIYRSDITRLLLGLLAMKEVDFKADVCKALAVWSETPGPASEAAVKEARDLLVRRIKVPSEMVALIVREKHPAAVEIVDELWAASPTPWESLYGEIGAPAEATLLKRFAGAEGMARHSVARLLGKTGGKDSLPALREALKDAGPELKVLLEKSIAMIEGRLNG